MHAPAAQAQLAQHYVPNIKRRLPSHKSPQCAWPTDDRKTDRFGAISEPQGALSPAVPRSTLREHRTARKCIQGTPCAIQYLHALHACLRARVLSHNEGPFTSSSVCPRPCTRRPAPPPPATSRSSPVPAARGPPTATAVLLLARSQPLVTRPERRPPKQQHSPTPRLPGTRLAISSCALQGPAH